jgi:hypothetical protein
MLIPPSLIYLKFGRFGLWLPVFILWPLLAVLEFLFLPIAVVVGLILMPWGRRRGLLIIKGIPLAMELFALTRGLIVDVTSHDGKGVSLMFI